MFDTEVAAAVARILQTISAPPNPHYHAAADDMPGNFDVWFDGGAAKHDTGMTTYYFSDGITALTGTSLRFRVTIRFADGRVVDVHEMGGET